MKNGVSHPLLNVAKRFVCAMLCVVLTNVGAACAAEPPVPAAVPLVAGFDRFGRHADIDKELAGQLLITELSCTACHANEDHRLIPRRGPVLDGAGSRLQRDWIESFVLSPSVGKPGTTMPDMLANLPIDQRQPAANALAVFLSSLRQNFPEVKASGLNPVPMEFWNRGSADHGRQLYHQIGCVACHEPDETYDAAAVKPSPLDELLDQLEPDELKEMGLSAAARKVNSVPHPRLPAKYNHKSLTFFLMNPEHTRPSGRMPNFSLQAVDAADIAAWLLCNQNQILKGQTPDPAENGTTADAPLIAQGRQLFMELRCAACHPIEGLTANSMASPLDALNLTSSRTCIIAADESNPAAAKLQKGQPSIVLDQPQRAAIASALAALKHLPSTTEAFRDDSDELTLSLLQQNCFACHERNTLGGVGRFRKPYFETAGHVDIGDEGRLPPALTGVGSRLTTSWLTDVFAGKGSVRPYMSIRMPVFPATVTKPLPEMFTRADRGSREPLAATDVFVRADAKLLTEAGRQLMDTGCVQCHSFKGESLPGTVGVDLEGVTSRMQPEWLHSFLKDPGALRQRTRMPTFFPNGKSQNRDVLNGDTELQLAAMYAYMKDLSKQPLPEKIRQARAQNYELTPVDRPLILRSFMPVAGTHAIAVGFPEHVHFAFDAEHISLAQAWRGRFLDAEGTWFVRFAPPADPLGEKLMTMPPGIAIAGLDSHESPWPADALSAGAKFSGYRLDAGGMPTFLYRVGNFRIEDRIEPGEDDGLDRFVAVIAMADSNNDSDVLTQLWFRAIVGRSLKPQAEHSVVNETELTVTVEQDVDEGEIRTFGQTSEWILPVHIDATADSRATIRVHYRW